jgi:hypothetical protein
MGTTPPRPGQPPVEPPQPCKPAPRPEPDEEDFKKEHDE